MLPVDLLVLSELLLELEKLGLQGRLLEVSGLLVGIDDLEGYELVERLAAVLSDEVVDLGSVGLPTYRQYPGKVGSRQAGTRRLTIFLVMLRMLLRKRVNDVGNTSRPWLTHFFRSRI